MARNTNAARRRNVIRFETAYLDDESRMALVNRLARLEGHVRAVRRMVEERRCADEVLLQSAALKAASTSSTPFLSSTS